MCRTFINKKMFLLLLCVQIAVCFYFGNRKAGFHEDEFYSFYSTNKTAGLFVGDRQWMEKEQYRNEFVVLPGEAFRYGIVAKMQSWDVHPPLYYFLLHTASSFFTGVFSKWLGIGINLIAFVLNFFLLWYLTERICGKENRQVAWLVCALWGFAPGVVSGVMFIRMYEWLTLFVMLCACIHIRAMKEKEMKVSRFYLPLALTVYLGFLTQYYYILFHIFMGAGFCLWLLLGFREDLGKDVRENRKKRWLLCFRYAVTCGIGLGMAMVSYPASLSHIFRGYRGTEAVSEFRDFSNTWERIRFFLGLLNEYVFGGGLWMLAAAAVLLAVGYQRRQRERGKDSARESYWLLWFAWGGYFLGVSKTALLLGVTSNRYQLPLYGIVILLMVVGICWGAFREPEIGKSRWTVPLGLLVLVLLFNLKGLFWEEKVFFLYEEEEVSLAYAKEHAHADVVVFYHEESPANVWRLSAELMEYDRVYLVSEGNLEPITDRKIKESKELVVYMADHQNPEQYSQMIWEANGQVAERKKIAEKEIWTLYEFF